LTRYAYIANAPVLWIIQCSVSSPLIRYSCRHCLFWPFSIWIFFNIVW
jgi:hypothetical protein